MKYSSDFYTSFILLGLCVLGAYGTLTSDASIDGEMLGPLALPWIAIAGGTFCSFLLLARSIFSPVHSSISGSKKVISRIFLFFAFFCIYLGTIVFLGNIIEKNSFISIPYGGGFSLSTFFFLYAAMRILGGYCWKKIIFISSGVTIALLFLFGYYFSIMLP